MREVQVSVEPSYKVLIDRGLVTDPARFLPALPEAFKKKEFFLISDDTVYALYGKTLADGLKASGIPLKGSFVFPAGEESKNAEVLTEALNRMAESGLKRDDVLIALGGGVTGDLAGFAAAVYQRGIEFIQVPTTALAAIDSSVGGKTAVNLRVGKNLIGSFHQPSIVLTDPVTFRSLSDAEFSNGLAEAIKTGILFDEELFSLLEDGSLTKDDERVEEMLQRAVSHKARIVEEDPLDHGRRQLLNLGHTTGHAVEAASAYTVPHGSAVSIGIAIFSRAMVKRGEMSEKDLQRILSALEHNSLPVECSYDTDTLYKYALSDKKRKNTGITIVLPLGIGNCTLRTIPAEELRDLIRDGREEAYGPLS